MPFLTTDWHIPGLLPQNELVLLDGLPGVGKSLLAAHLAARFSKVDGQKVVYFYTSEQGDASGQFLAANEPNFDNCYSHHLDPDVVEPGDKPFCMLEPMVLCVRNFLDEHKPTILFLDGFDDILSAGPDLSPYEACKLWRQLKSYAIEYRCTIVIIRHKGMHDSRLTGNVSRTAQRIARFGMTMHWHPTDPTKRIITIARYQFGPTGTQFHMTIDAESKVGLRLAHHSQHVAPANKVRTWQTNPLTEKMEKAAMSLASRYMADSPMSIKEVKELMSTHGIPGRVFHKMLTRGNFGLRLDTDNNQCLLTPPGYDENNGPQQPIKAKVISTFPTPKPVKPYTNLAEIQMSPLDINLAENRRNAMNHNNIQRAAT